MDSLMVGGAVETRVFSLTDKRQLRWILLSCLI